MAFGRKAQVVSDPRSGDRQAVVVQATARLLVGEAVPITIENLSSSGFRAAIPLDLKPGMLLRIGLPTGRSPHAIVARVDGDQYGCAFTAPLDPEDLELLVS